MIYDLYNTVDGIQCIEYNAQNTMNRLQCTNYDLQKIMHIMKCREQNADDANIIQLIEYEALNIKINKLILMIYSV